MTMPSLKTICSAAAIALGLVLGSSPAFAKIWGPLSLGMERSEIDSILRSSPAFEPPGEMTVMGSTSENDRFTTKKTFYGDICELSFRFDKNDMLEALTFFPKSGFPPSQYHNRFKARYKNLYMSISDRYGLPLNSPAWPDPNRLKPDRVVFLHIWNIAPKQSIMTGIMKDANNSCYVATTFIGRKIRPGQNKPETVKEWDAVPEFYDMLKADALNAQGMAALSARKGQDALEAFEKAAAMGSSRAYWALGQLYEGGKGVPRDKEKSDQCYRIAAEKGFALATVMIDKDYNKAMDILEIFPEDAQALLSTCQRAAAEGCVAEQFNVGIMYQNGYGLKKDKAQAAKWLGMAAKKGDKQAAAALKKLS